MKLSDQEFILEFQNLGPAALARKLNISERNIFRRRARIERNNNGEKIAAPTAPSAERWNAKYPPRVPLSVANGTLIIGGDAHYWPGIVSTAHKAFCKLVSELKPQAVILNGDTFDGAMSSRHPASSWEKRPTTKELLETIEDRLAEIEAAGGKHCQYLWNIGNHDQRFESKLANQAPEFEGVPGFSLSDHFLFWRFAMSVWINESVVVKHRYKGGIHATHNATLNAGKSIVTNHLHSLKVTPFDDYNGTRFGVDAGTLADPSGPQFTYGEDNPANHRSGFVVLTFVDGRLLWPEVVRVVSENKVEFRGQVFDV